MTTKLVAVYAVANRWPRSGMVEVVTYTDTYKRIGKMIIRQVEADALELEWISLLQVYRETKGTMGLR